MQVHFLRGVCSHRICCFIYCSVDPGGRRLRRLDGQHQGQRVFSPPRHSLARPQPGVLELQVGLLQNILLGTLIHFRRIVYALGEETMHSTRSSRISGTPEHPFKVFGSLPEYQHRLIVPQVKKLDIGPTEDG